MIIYKENSKIYFYSNYKRWESVAMLLKLEWLSFINWSGWPISSSFPFLKTAIRSESIIVFNLWAMVKTVQSANSFRRVDCIKSSVSWSTVAVASSRTKTFVFRSKALARQINCLCPTEKFEPPSETSLFRPSPRVSTTWFFKWANSRLFQSFWSLWSPTGSRLNL